MRAKLSLALIFAAITAAVMLTAVPAAAESTWDQIKRTGKLRYGAVDYPPSWYRDKTSGKWTGTCQSHGSGVTQPSSKTTVSGLLHVCLLEVAWEGGTSQVCAPEVGEACVNWIAAVGAACRCLSAGIIPDCRRYLSPALGAQ